ncbi:MAG: arginine--tRNA ligase, partial [Lentisphaeria bacterium]|nr:arginine--tRNA ligase [Lentisphaeria bacterium]
MDFAFITDLQDHFAAEFHAAGVEIIPDLCPAEFAGDLTINCFLLAKQLRRNPMQIAAAGAEYLQTHADIAEAECVKAFINVTLVPRALFEAAIGDETALMEDAVLPEAERERVLIEFSAPNTNKPQHLGHVRNNTIGMATATLLERVGHDITRINLVNDRGIHICKSMLAYQRFGNDETPESTEKKGDHLVGNYYVKFDSELRGQLEKLRADKPALADKSSDELFLQTEIGRAAQDMLIAWEQDDEQVRALWGMMNQWVFDGFAETYDRMGITFDRTYLESQTYMLGKDIIQDGVERGVFKKRDDGATVIEFEEKGLDPKVVLRSDGTSVYVTQDIGTTLLKQQDYEPARQIWVVGDEQIYHFRVLFAILKALGYEWADNLTHMAYGMV